MTDPTPISPEEFFNFLGDSHGTSVLQFVADALPYEFWIMNSERQYVLQNAASRQSWGDLCGQTIDLVEAPDADLAVWRENDLRALDGEHVVGCYERRVGAHTNRFVDVLSPLLVGDRVTGILGLNLHVDQPWPSAPAKDDEDTLKLSARGFAHDLNNLLTVIVGNANLAGLDGANAAEHLKTIKDASNQAASVAADLRGLGSSSRPKPPALDLRDAVWHAVEVLRTGLPANVGLETALPDEPAPVVAEATHLTRIALNLLLNAIEAVGDRGTVLAEVETLAGDSRGGRMVRLTVVDDGCGIPVDRIARIFEPLESTKQLGSGLGLWIVKHLAQELDGTVFVKSRVGQGTRFDVVLPLAE